MSEPLCRHETITTWGTSDNRLWACTSCSRRFYPACETCVDVGHRNETHPLAAPAEGPDPCPHCDMEHVWPCPTIPRCDEPGCERETSCGFPTDTGYRRTCGDHYRAAEANR